MKLSLEGVKLSKLTKLSLAVGGVLLLALLGLTLFTGEEPKKTAAARGDATPCPDCGRPLTREAKRTGECPFCKMDNPGGPKKLMGSRVEGGVYQSKTIAVVIISLFVVLLVVNIGIFVRAKWMKPADDGLFHMNCRKCDRRVRYRERQAGILARCPNCRVLIRFPDAAAKSKGRWGLMKGWLTMTKKNNVQKDSA